MKTFRFGIIGCGLMGREFASAAARWCHLLEPKARPVITAICDMNESLFPWYQNNFESITLSTTDYKQLLASENVDAVYCAVPHTLHAEMYTDILKAGKHLFGEKPFGIDKAANDVITAEIARHPDLLVRCSSEFPYYPAAQRIAQAVKADELGDIIEVESGFLHSSDMNPDKPINWKRMVEVNGAYGCIGDLGMHAAHMPMRMGWWPRTVYAQLTNLMPTRPDKTGEAGNRVPCKTWDNATMHCRVEKDGKQFPMSLKTWRIAPSETDTWYLKVLGTRKSLSFTTKYPKTLLTLDYEPGGPQVWQQEDMGYQTLFPTITGAIFEFGFTDSILQMWAAYLDELAGGNANGFSCATPEEAAFTHQLFTAALASHEANEVVAI